MKPYFDNGVTRLYHADARHLPLPDRSVHCIVTSPPYWGLRDYGVENAIGMEPTFEEYVAQLVEISGEIRRVLRDDGTFWLNLGDSYSGSGKGMNWDVTHSVGEKQETNIGSLNAPVKFKRMERGSGRWGGGDRAMSGLKPKDLAGIPWRVAFALQEDGWWLRSDIIWSKPNPMPESVKDRPTRSHEYLFMLTKSARYYYDAAAISEPPKNAADDARRIDQQRDGHKSVPTAERNGLKVRGGKQRGHSRRHEGINDWWDALPKVEQQAMGTNKRSVWTIAPQNYPGAHYATFPEALVEPCILAGSPPGGLVLDPFVGSGTTCAVAQRLGRRSIGIDLSAAYLDMAVRRIFGVPLPLPLRFVS